MGNIDTFNKQVDQANDALKNTENLTKEQIAALKQNVETALSSAALANEDEKKDVHVALLELSMAFEKRIGDKKVEAEERQALEELKASLAKPAVSKPKESQPLPTVQDALEFIQKNPTIVAGAAGGAMGFLYSIVRSGRSIYRSIKEAVLGAVVGVGTKLGLQRFLPKTFDYLTNVKVGPTPESGTKQDEEKKEESSDKEKESAPKIEFSFKEGDNFLNEEKMIMVDGKEIPFTVSPETIQVGDHVYGVKMVLTWLQQTGIRLADGTTDTEIAPIFSEAYWTKKGLQFKGVEYKDSQNNTKNRAGSDIMKIEDLLKNLPLLVSGSNSVSFPPYRLDLLKK